MMSSPTCPCLLDTNMSISDDLSRPTEPSREDSRPFLTFLQISWASQAFCSTWLKPSRMPRHRGPRYFCSITCRRHTQCGPGTTTTPTASKGLCHFFHFHTASHDVRLPDRHLRNRTNQSPECLERIQRQI